LSIIRTTPRSPLFPYTTLFRSIVHTVELYAKPILDITERDRTFSVAKLFFAYGLGNALTFPFAVGATTILWPGPPTAPNVYATRSEEHTSELQSRFDLVCRLLL